MKRLYTWILLSISMTYAFSVNALVIQEMSKPLSNAELEQVRGGFSFNSKRFINIGISISSSINGHKIFNSHIANLRIRNGRLEVERGNAFIQSQITNVIQHGLGNYIESQAQQATAIEPDPVSAPDTAITSTTDNSPEYVATTPAQPDQAPVVPPTQPVPVQAPSIPSVDITSSSALSTIIQNTVGNSVLGISTIVDIDAPTQLIFENIRFRNRLERALEIGQY